MFAATCANPLFIFPIHDLQLVMQAPLGAARSACYKSASAMLSQSHRTVATYCCSFIVSSSIHDLLLALARGHGDCHPGRACLK
jgi:hypothetical protein